MGPSQTHRVSGYSKGFHPPRGQVPGGATPPAPPDPPAQVCFAIPARLSLGGPQKPPKTWRALQWQTLHNRHPRAGCAGSLSPSCLRCQGEHMLPVPDTRSQLLASAGSLELGRHGALCGGGAPPTSPSSQVFWEARVSGHVLLCFRPQPSTTLLETAPEEAPGCLAGPSLLPRVSSWLFFLSSPLTSGLRSQDGQPELGAGRGGCFLAFGRSAGG